MKKLNALFAVLALLCLLSSLGCTTTSNAASKSKTSISSISKIRQGTLDNGMSFFVRENGEPKNRIQLRLVVKAGSCLEDDDQKGVAHFVEHLCFNGTENFKKSAIVDYFESIGMKFGPEVNAYTTYEQTVYMLEIPANNPEILKTSLMVLRDWACAVSFDQEEIDKERGIIIEEWRYRTKTLKGRYTAFEDPIYVRGSRFEERPVLGDMDIIKNISRKRIIDFYKKWYRPEFMSVIVIGDANASMLENAVREVMGTIPASKQKIKLPEFTVPIPKEKTIDILRDKETTISEIYIVKRKEKPLTTEEEYAWSFFEEIFDQRCAELTKSLNAEWIYAGTGKRSQTNKTEFYVLQVCPKEGRFEQGFKIYLEELDNFLKYGPTESEMKIERQSHIQKLNQSYKNVNNHSNSEFTNNLINYTTSGGIIFAPSEETYQKEIKILNQLKAENIRQMAIKAFSDRGTTMLLFVPEKCQLPSESEIMDIWKNHKTHVSKSKYEDSEEDSMLMPRPAKKAQIKETKKLKELGATQYTFENGMNCIFKKTNFKNDEMVIYGYSTGGYYQLKEEEMPSASVCTGFMWNSGAGGKTNSQITKICQSKRINITMGINNSTEYFISTANSENIEQNLQLINMTMRSPEFSDAVWAKILEEYNRRAASFGTTASEVYTEKITHALYGDSLFKNLINKKFVSKLNQKEAERIYKDRIMNAGDFTFVIVGDFDEKKIVDLCAYYIGTLATGDKRDKPKCVLYPFPKKSETITVKFGEDKIGNVYMCFGGELPASKNMEEKFKDEIIIEQLASYLDIKLREVIREEKGGTYTIETSGWTSGISERDYKVEIQFHCEPERLEELRQEVINTIKDLKKGNVSDEIISKLRESYERDRETYSRNNYWWTNRIICEYITNEEPLWYTTNYKKIVSEWISKESILEAANKYLNTDRVFTAYLRPE